MLSSLKNMSVSLRWRQNGRDSVSNHQPGHCLLSLLFGLRSKKTSKLRVTGLCTGNSPGPVNSPHKGPVTRKMFPFDDVIMRYIIGVMLPFSWRFTSRSHDVYLEYHDYWSRSRLLQFITTPFRQYMTQEHGFISGYWSSLVSISHWLDAINFYWSQCIDIIFLSHAAPPKPHLFNYDEVN